MTAVSLRLPDDVSKRLRQLAARTGRSRTFYILAAIREHLADLEDVYLAEQRLVDLWLGKSHAVPLEDGMCCNLQKATRAPLVESTRLRLMPPLRTACG